MDDFGVLVQNYGIKPQGKSAPMAASKTATRTDNYNSVNQDPTFGTKPFSRSSKPIHNSNSRSGSVLDDQNDSFGFNSSHKSQNYDVFDDVFQMPTKNGGGRGLDFDVESMFKGSLNLNANERSGEVNDDMIWGFSGKRNNVNVVVDSDDLLSSDPIDDFLGNLGVTGSGSRRLNRKRLDENRGDSVDSDDLIAGFGRSNAVNDRAQTSSKQKSSSLSSLEELEDFATGSIKKSTHGNSDAFTVKNEANKTSRGKSQEINFIDIDGGLDGDSIHQKEVKRVNGNLFQAEAPDLDSYFRANTRKSVPASQDTMLNSMKTEEGPDLFSGTTISRPNKSTPRVFADDFSSIFGEAATPSGQFEEFEGESDGRRKARLGREQRTEARKAEAVAELNRREFQAQLEQEERHRIAETIDMEMKRWVAGKDGNLRALLSSLEQVLAPEFGWRPVALTDLITSSQVKIAYKKAALYVHPDKVQQKGANLQQKYVAEKVFDLLKEAWNKFSSEELR